MRLDKDQSQRYIENVFIQESSERLEILKNLKEKNKDGIQVSAVEGSILKFLCKIISAKKVVEIGTLFGYSTSWFLEAVGSDGHVWSFEKNEEHYAYSCKHLIAHIHSKNLNILLGDALHNLKTIESQGPFDVIFIDANKSAYMDYLLWADKNIKKGGLIIADNSFLFGQVFIDEEPPNNKKAWKAMRELNEFLAQSKNYESIVLPTAEGMTIGQRV